MVTRKSDSVGTELAAKGAQVVKADIREIASLEQAFKGVYGVFGVTNCSLPFPLCLTMHADVVFESLGPQRRR